MTARVELVAEAKLPIAFDNLREALTAFLDLARNRCVSQEASSINIFLSETGCKATCVLAEAFPPDYQAFGTGPILDRRKLLSQSEFLIRMKTSRPSDSVCDATLTDFFSFEQARELVRKVAEALPPSGRGIAMMLSLGRMKLRGAPETVCADLMFSRWRSGSRRKEAALRVSCPARSKTDTDAKQALRAVAELLNLKLSKPSIQPPLGRGSERPAPETLWAAQKAFQAAFDLALKDIEERDITLHSAPPLFSRFEAFGKRIADTQNGISEKIDLVAELKRLIRERQVGYAFDASDAECVTFRKSLTESLDGLLTFERFHHHGLGKSFTINYGVQFPGDPELQPSPVVQVFRDSLFTLFHRNWEEPAWAYSTGAELEEVLTSCGALLASVLPLLEKRLVETLSPLPEKLPSFISSLGALTAKEAYTRALPVSQAWAEDVELVSIGSQLSAGPSMDMAVLAEAFGPALDPDGRLQPHGWWSVNFLSRRRGTHLFVLVPHTGAIRWSTFGYPLREWRPATLSSRDWLDSAVIALSANSVLQPHLSGDTYRLAGCLYRLGANPPRYEKVVWEVTAMLRGKGRFDSRQVRMLFDPWTGKLLETDMQP
jgi:hypothetical protein